MRGSWATAQFAPEKVRQCLQLFTSYACISSWYKSFLVYFSFFSCLGCFIPDLLMQACRFRVDLFFFYVFSCLHHMLVFLAGTESFLVYFSFFSCLGGFIPDRLMASLI
jgi:hypothetical protein